MVSFFLPEICPVCQKEGRLLQHRACLGHLEKGRLSSDGRCPVCFLSACKCSSAHLFFERHTSLYRLTPAWQKTLAAWKYRGQRSLCQIFLPALRQALPEMSDFDTIVVTRNGKKGFDGRCFEPLIDLVSCLSFDASVGRASAWRKAGQSQKKLARRERHFTLPGSFQLSKAGKSCLLLDDVFSTGATANEIARILKNNGAKFVSVLSLLLNDDFEAVNGFATDQTDRGHKNNHNQRTNSPGRFALTGRCAG
jgi:predicted amidophosphoribosyltransferase